MKKSLLLMLVAVLAATSALADERPDHFEGKPAGTLEEAVGNFSEANAELRKILAKKELTAQEMHEVHQLTYTLENALERINTELADLAETLEEVHVASETADKAAVKKQGQAYLEKAGKLVPEK